MVINGRTEKKQKKQKNDIWAENLNVGRNQPYISAKFASTESVEVGQNIAMNA